MKIAVVGGGAAGLMAAEMARETNPSEEIFLLEKNDGLGKKVIISGGGRCNVVTGVRDVRTVLTKYPRGGKFLSSAMYAFPPEAIFEWFEDHGVPLKTEDDLRVFPCSDDGNDVVRVFADLFRSSSIHILLRANVQRIEKTESGFFIQIKNHPQPLTVDRVILTTGGQAYRQTGSTGDGYAFAISLGHTITALAPSLSSFTTRETWPAEVSGLSFTSAQISANTSSKAHFTGPFLFTHKGISGPATFALSSLIAFEKFDPAHPIKISIDLFPEGTLEDLRTRLADATLQAPKKQSENVLSFLIPKSLAQIAVRELKIKEKRANELSKTELLSIATWLKHIPLQVIGRGAGDEFVTAGGINLKEVDPKTMESLICPGLFFAGEILDIDGFTGGYNLSSSWATGRLAGISAAAN
ncbi:NAD(P)/FAD-dependent oxidoreductase [Candidatus Uhrbacteria bacterium]|nr:NAD(P)/FAD-dependent oxidoreductase [Candidatus Uhrbacteria bacterium]